MDRIKNNALKITFNNGLDKRIYPDAQSVSRFERWFDQIGSYFARNKCLFEFHDFIEQRCIIIDLSQIAWIEWFHDPVPVPARPAQWSIDQVSDSGLLLWNRSQIMAPFDLAMDAIASSNLDMAALFEQVDNLMNGFNARVVSGDGRILLINHDHLLLMELDLAVRGLIAQAHARESAASW